jgi:hypothetical protein
MPEVIAPNPQLDADQLDAAADQEIAACGGDAREAVKTLIIANEFLEAAGSDTDARRNYCRTLRRF